MEPGGRQPTPHSRSASRARALVHCILEVVTEARAGLIPGKQITKGVSLLEPLGSGGMGAVWLADHQGLKTRVVVKFMLLGLDSSDSARTRFSREAAAAAQVKSPHVVQMLDHGLTDDGIPFIVMEHLEGHDLGDEIEAHGALDPAKVVTVVTQIGRTCVTSSCAPTTGSNQCCSVPPIASSPPEATEPIAKRIIGHVISFGDSCGCAFSSQRFSPKNVMIITRVM